MSIGAVTAKLGVFLSERAADHGVAPVADTQFSGNLARIRDEVNHHVIPLALLAHSDGETVADEQWVILNYCLERAGRAGIELSEPEMAAFAAYLRSFRPTRMQLTMAMKRLASESKDELMGLVVAAQAVVDADHERSERETGFLATIRRELKPL